MRKFQKIVRSLCLATTTEVFESLKALGFELIVCPKSRRRYAYRPGTSPTSPLLVCHADTVCEKGYGKHNYSYNHHTSTVNSIALDDRLGIACMVWSIHKKSRVGDFAMLVCDEEESGNSSAALFDTENRPNWMVELDRRGIDVVAYEYDTPILRSLLRTVGWDIGQGSFSDICYLEHLEVAGFNVGVGYHREHSEACYADLTDTLEQLERLEAFAERFADIRFDHVPAYGYNDGYDPYRDDPYWKEWTDYRGTSHMRLTDNPGWPEDEAEYEDVDDDDFDDIASQAYDVKRW